MDMGTISLDDLDDLEGYFAEYVAAYRREYETFVSTPPRGPGYPRVTVSPYLGDAKFDVYLPQSYREPSDKSSRYGNNLGRTSESLIVYGHGEILPTHIHRCGLTLGDRST